MPSPDNQPGAASPPHPHSHSSELEEERERNRGRGRRLEIETAGRCGTPASASASSAASPSTTINLSKEYTLAIQTTSYNEIWHRIHHAGDAVEGADEGPTIAHVLQPDRASAEQILRAAPATRMARLVSDYMESSEHTSVLCLSLQGSVARARTIYHPIGELLELIPVCGTSSSCSSAVDLTPALCNKAFDTFILFKEIANPFSFPSSSSASTGTTETNNGTSNGRNSQFQGMRGSFQELKQQLDKRLHEARRRDRLLRRTERGSGICLIACTTGIAVVGLVLASHIVAALAAGSACILGGSCCDLVAIHGRREDIEQLDAAARNTYVLNNDLDTIERLVTRLHDTIEDDKKLVRLGVEGGRGQRHPIEHVVRHLRKNHRSLLQQLSDLDEHICLYFASVNRVRSLLLQQIHRPNS